LTEVTGVTKNTAPRAPCTPHAPHYYARGGGAVFRDTPEVTTTPRAARLLYPKYGRLFQPCESLLMCLPECQHSTTRKPRCRRFFSVKICQHHSLA